MIRDQGSVGVDEEGKDDGAKSVQHPGKLCGGKAVIGNEGAGVDGGEDPHRVDGGDKDGKKDQAFGDTPFPKQQQMVKTGAARTALQATVYFFKRVIRVDYTDEHGAQRFAPFQGTDEIGEDIDKGGDEQGGQYTARGGGEDDHAKSVHQHGSRSLHNYRVHHAAQKGCLDQVGGTGHQHKQAEEGSGQVEPPSADTRQAGAVR